MKYFIPEWDDRVDPYYDFSSDAHSPTHKKNPVENGAYLWDIFGLANVPIDGVLVSRITIEQSKRKCDYALKEGIHKVLRLPSDFEILGDCGAFGYVEDKVPPFDTLEMLQYYHDLGFNYGVTVDHLVVPQFREEKEDRMKITYENGVKAYYEWAKKFKNDFQLLVAVQGWDVSDYLKMYKNYIDLGVTNLSFGGLARSPTSFIIRLVNQLISEIKESRKVPSYLHFLGLARFALFPKLAELEELGVKVGFDSTSYLRKAWLSTPTSQLNYLTIKGKGYTAIRIPLVKRIKQHKDGMLPQSLDRNRLNELEQECLSKLRLYDKEKTNLQSVLSSLLEFAKDTGQSPELIKFYKRTLEEKPWNSCDCPVCKSIGIDVVIFRGNNRNRRRGFHNVYVFYSVLKNPTLWPIFINRQNERQEIELLSLRKGSKVLIITECTKQKLGYSSSTSSSAKMMYRGRLFKAVRAYAEAMGFDYVIISAKFGLVFPDEIIEGYEKTLQSKEDVRSVQRLVENRLQPILKNYDKIIVIAGEKYRMALHNLWDDRFINIRSKGYGDLCSIVEKAMPDAKTLLEFTHV